MPILTEATMKYVMLIMDTEAGLSLPEDENQAWYAEILGWYDKLRGSGKLAAGGEQLQAARTAKTIRRGKVTDGPFMETKEVLGGFSLLETDTMDEAVELARTWPGVDRGLVTIELRPVVEM
jgi:hypothetical protein